MVIYGDGKWGDGEKWTWSSMANVVWSIGINAMFFLMHQPIVGLSPSKGESVFNNGAACVDLVTTLLTFYNTFYTWEHKIKHGWVVSKKNINTILIVHLKWVKFSSTMMV